MTTKTKSKKSLSTDSIRSNLLTAEQEINAAIMERAEPIRGLLLALLTRQHLLLLGPPGTAKSMLTDMAQAMLTDAERFSLLLTKTTLPDELFGMWDVGAITKGKMQRLTLGGTLRTAQIAFLDECFKANSTTLNSMLGALNERKFRNGTEGEVSLPLVSCVGASNEYPQGEDLAALYDRFILRYWINPLEEQANWLNLLTSTARPTITAKITLAELEQAQQAVSQVTIPQQLGATLLQIKSGLGSVGITASDRRWRQSMDVLRAQAWLSGRDEVTKDDLLSLQSVLWNNFEEEGRKVGDVLLAICAPKLKELLTLMDMAYEQVRTLRDYGTRSDVTRGEVSEAKQKFSDLRDQARKLIPDAGPRGAAEAERLTRLDQEAAKLYSKAAW